MLSFFKRRQPVQPLPNPETTDPETTDPDGIKAATSLAASLYGPADIDGVLGAVQAAGFSQDDYFQANPDLQNAFSNSRRAMLHFLAMVRNERRKFPIQLRAAGLTEIHELPADDRTMIAGLLASLVDAATGMGTAPRLEKLQKLWPEIQALRRLGGRPYVIVGDSHSTFYRRSTVRGGDWLLPLHVCCSGGSAIGLGNPQSRSGYRQQLLALAEFLAAAEPGHETPLLLQFGQVDLEFVQPFRRIRQGTPNFDPDEFSAFSETSVRAYASFLEELIAPAWRPHVVILGVFPPAIKDEPLRRGYINNHIASLEGMDDAGLQDALRGLEWPDLATRTRLHADYNERLKTAVTAAGFRFASNFDGLLSRDGVLADRFIQFGKGEEHHLDFSPTETLLADTVWRLLEPNRPVRRISFEDLAETPDPHLLPPLDRPDVDPAALSPDQRAWFNEGVVIKKNFLPAALLDPYIARRAAFRPGTAWNAVGWPDGNCYEGVPELRDIALYPPLMALLRDLIGEPMLFHLALTGWISTERDWHQDDYLNPDFINTWYAAVWIALDTVTPESGPFEYVPGSHRWPLLRGEKVRSFLTDEELGRKAPNTKLVEWPKYAERFLSPAIEEKIETSGLPILPFLAEKGDILIWHARLMHRGAKRVEEWTTAADGKVYPKHPRRSLITHYSGIHHRPDMPTRTQTPTGETYATFNTPLVLE